MLSFSQYLLERNQENRDFIIAFCENLRLQILDDIKSKPDSIVYDESMKDDSTYLNISAATLQAVIQKTAKDVGLDNQFVKNLTTVVRIPLRIVFQTGQRMNGVYFANFKKVGKKVHPSLNDKIIIVSQSMSFPGASGPVPTKEEVKQFFFDYFSRKQIENIFDYDRVFIHELTHWFQDKIKTVSMTPDQRKTSHREVIASHDRMYWNKTPWTWKGEYNAKFDTTYQYKTRSLHDDLMHYMLDQQEFDSESVAIQQTITNHLKTTPTQFTNYREFINFVITQIFPDISSTQPKTTATIRHFMISMLLEPEKFPIYKRIVASLDKMMKYVYTMNQRKSNS